MIKNRLFKKEKVGIILSLLFIAVSLTILCWCISQIMNKNFLLMEATLSLIIFIINIQIFFLIICGITKRRKKEKTIIKVRQNLSNTDFKKITLAIPQREFLSYYDKKQVDTLNRKLIIYGGKYGTSFYARLENDAIHIILKEYDGNIVFEDRTNDYLWFSKTFDF